jgi:anti-anti-sigma regulatory factor
MANSMAHLNLLLEGPLVLTRASALQAQLLEALDEASDICLDVSNATDFDISFLQILIAAHKTARIEKKTLTVSESGSERLAAEIARCGLPASVLPDFRNVFPS